MASVVSNRRGGWEIRESRSTPKGPRSKTLAYFRALDREVLAKAEARAETEFDGRAVVRSAWRAGAEVLSSPAEESARHLLTEIARGAEIPPGLASAITGHLERSHPPELSYEAMQAAEWAGASMSERGRVLYELMLLADALPQRRAGTPLKFPRMIAA